MREGEVRSGGKEEAAWDSGVNTDKNNERVSGLSEEPPWLGVSAGHDEGGPAEEEDGREDEKGRKEEKGREEQKASGDITHGVDSFEEVNIFLRNPSATKGIHCRLGMDGVRRHYPGLRGSFIFCDMCPLTRPPCEAFSWLWLSFVTVSQTGVGHQCRPGQ